LTINTMKSQSLTPIYTTAYVFQHMCNLGVNPELLLKDSGLRADDFLLPSRMLNLWQEQQVLSNALAHSTSRRLGLEVGLNVRVSAIGLLGYAMMTAPTLRAGLELPLSLPAVLGTYFDLNLDVLHDEACFTAVQSRGTYELEPFLTEVCFGSFKSMVEDMLYSEIQLSKVCLSYAADEGMKEDYEAAFQCPVLFDQATSMVVFPVDTLNSKLPLTDKLCHLSVVELCHIQNRELNANREWLELLRDIISNNLINPPNLDELAEKMRCSSRTLRRRLQTQNTSYRTLLDELRFEKAKELLQNTTMSIENIAECIGFSDSAGLRRAFQRWRGVPPNSFRR